MQFQIGVDEVGRGPLAGPMTVGALLVSDDFDRTFFKGIRDSKQFSEKQREEWYEKMRRVGDDMLFATASISPAAIDKLGMTRAASRGVALAVGKLNPPPDQVEILLDGLLHAPEFFIFQRTIIGGDASEPIIAAASIVAKVRRDRLRKNYAKAFPGYGFEEHKGYGTAAHYAALERLGPCAIHRLSFL